MSGVQLKFEDVLAEVHTTYSGVIATLTNDLAEARAANKALSGQIEAFRSTREGGSREP